MNAPPSAEARSQFAAPRNPALVSAGELEGFDEIIDVRSEDEFAEDHLPGAINCPVLTNAERARVGTLYKQVSSFEARKVGAALVARNIAAHLDRVFRDRPRSWRPLLYCWRGGQRSGAMTTIFRQIGWDARQLDGGYKAWRRQVAAQLAELPGGLDFRVVCGPTGSGKSRLLAALAAQGAQVLDLEALAAHRGSLLGSLPDAPQPSQKRLESRIWQALRGFDATRPVFVEAESRKIGELRVPDALLARMWAGACLRMEMPLEARVGLLLEDYAHFFDQPQALAAKLAFLKPLHGGERIAAWHEQIAAQAWQSLVTDLLLTHYDPAYHRSTTGHYPRLSEARVIAAPAADSTTLARLAGELVAALDACGAAH